MRNKVKLARSLIEGKFDNCFILTFNADLPFFERFVFRHVYDNDCRNLVILMDPDHYTEELRNSIPILNYVGQRYVCAPATGIAGVRFHPKLILQTSETQGRLFLGSGNLSQPGLTRNWEIVTCFDYDDENPDPVALEAFRSLLRYLRQVSDAAGIPEFVRRRTRRLIASTPWTDPIDRDPEWPPTFQILDNLEQALWDQMIAAVSSQVKHVRIVSPYFDPACHAFRRLFEDFQPQSVCLYIQPDQHNLDAQRLRAVVNRYRGQFEVRALDLNGRRLHAKALLFETERGVWLLTGSANFSVAGLIKSARFGNAELGILRHEANPRYFDAWWNVLHQRSRSIDIDWETPLAGSEPPDEQPSTKPQIVLRGATVDDTGLLRLRCASELSTDIRIMTLEFTAANVHTWKVDTWQLEGNMLSIILPDIWHHRLEAPWLVTLCLETSKGTLTSSPILVHHTGQLYRYSRPPRTGKRVPIPEGLIPEDQTQLLDLMHLFQNLLIASSSEIQTKHHRIRMGRESKADASEDEMPEDDYDPETQISRERVRYPDSAGFYSNYYDRLTFRDLMHAALKASYHAPRALRPSAGPSPDPSESPTSSKGPSALPKKRKHRPSTDVHTQQERLAAEMERGFQRLIKRFNKSAEDRDYLSKMPPSYLCDFYCGIVQFMGVVQHHGLLTTTQYVQLATGFLVAFYGIAGHVGVWQGLKYLHPPNTLKEIETYWHIHVRSWMLLYQCWCLLSIPPLAAQRDDLCWRLSDIARHVIDEIGGEKKLCELAVPLEQQAERLWPEETDRPDFDTFRTVLLDAAQHYSIELIREELKQLGASSVEVGHREGVTPDLHVTIPIKNVEAPHFLSTFQKFVRIHRAKPQIRRIRTQFKEPSVVSSQRGRSVIFMYQPSEASLAYAVRYESPGNPYTYDPDLELRQLRLGDLLSFQSLHDVLDWPHQIDHTRKNAD